MRKFIATALAAVMLAGSVTAATISPAEARNHGVFFPHRGGFAGANHFQHRGNVFAGNRFQGGHRFYGYNRGYRGGYYGGGYYGDGYGYDYDDGSGALAAGVIGLAAGALLSGALHHPYGGSCAARFRTYNHATGTYMGSDGHRHICR